MEFYFVVPSEIVFGPGSSKNVGDIVKQFGGKNVLCIYDPGIKAIVVEIIENLKAKGLNVVEFDKVVPDPPIECVNEAAAFARETNTDVIVAIGGGSAMDTAKAANVLLTNPSPLTLYSGFNLVKNPTKILIAIPTTAGTGSEVSTMGVITDKANKKKLNIGGRYCGATVALADPLLTVGLPPAVTAYTGIDALAHAIEAYTSNWTMPPTDALALKSIGLTYNNLSEATKNGKNVEARSNMMLGSLLAGICITNALVTLVHAIAHPLGAHCNIAHGIAVGALLPYVIEYNIPACSDRLKDVGIAMGLPVRDVPDEDAAKAVVDALKALNVEVGIPTLKEAGISKDILPLIVAETLNEATFNFNRRKATEEDILNILEKAY